MASVISDPSGRKRIQFFNASGKRKTIRLGKASTRSAEKICTHVEALVRDTMGHPPDNETVEWAAMLADRDPKLHGRLVKAGLAKSRQGVERAIGPFTDTYISQRTDAKPRTIIAMKRAAKHLSNHFGAGRDMQDVSEADAEEFYRYLIRPKADPEKPDPQAGAGLAVNTARNICSRSKQFFRQAVRKRMLRDNPFAGIKCQIQANAEREYFVSREEAVKVLAACPDAEWRLIFALSRFGGLRCPSEHLALKWSDVHWNENRFTVHSPKTEHHEGKESRVVPIFPELRTYLEEAYAAAAEGAEHVIARYRDGNANLRTQLNRIIRRAGLKPWPKLFHNLRSTRETELAETFPIHVVCDWIGNSQAVAKKHYLQITDGHFQQAIEATDGKAAHFAAHSASRSTAQDNSNESPETQETAFCAVLSDSDATCNANQVAATGLEPVTRGL